MKIKKKKKEGREGKHHNTTTKKERMDSPGGHHAPGTSWPVLADGILYERTDRTNARRRPIYSEKMLMNRKLSAIVAIFGVLACASHAVASKDDKRIRGNARATPRASGSDAKCVKITVAGPAGMGGDIIAQLSPHDAPNTVANFLSYVEKKYYQGTIFHRVIKGFMVQGGGFTQSFYQNDATEKPGQSPPIKNEAGQLNTRGTLSMARTNDPDSATSQFFINTVDNKSLDKSPNGAGYAVFGKVLKGMDVVDAIESTQTTTMGSFADVPQAPIYMKDVDVTPCP